MRRLVERGGILAVPTESSYGLGVDPANHRGVEAIYRIKARERNQPLPVVIADLAQLAPLGVDPADPWLARVAALWPAPLTVVLPTARPLPAAAGSGTLAVRMPAHAGLRGLLLALGTPLTATSANRSGEPPLCDPSAVAELLVGEDAVVLDDGVLPGGPPSTLVGPAAQGMAVLRPGRFPVAALTELGIR